jgi:hypothetical protein
MGQMTPAPNGTMYAVPAGIPAVQGLIVTSTILVFAAFLAGAGQMDMPAAMLSLLAFVLTVAAYGSWVALGSANLGRMPVYTENLAMLWPAQFSDTYQATLGPSFSLAVISSILSLLCFVFHMVASKGEGEADKPAASSAPPPAAQTPAEAPKADVENPPAAAATALAQQ